MAHIIHLRNSEKEEATDCPQCPVPTHPHSVIHREYGSLVVTMLFYSSPHRVRLSGPALNCLAGVYLINFCIGNLLRVTQLYSPSARCNVHNGSPPPGLIKFTTLGHSICTYSMALLSQAILCTGATLDIL